MPCNGAETTALKNSAQVGAIILQMAISKDRGPRATAFRASTVARQTSACDGGGRELVALTDGCELNRLRERPDQPLDAAAGFVTLGDPMTVDPPGWVGGCRL
jgi:hypothetical protein